MNHLSYLRQTTPLQDITQTTAVSGAQAIFATSLANVNQCKGQTYSFYDQLPDRFATNSLTQAFYINYVDCNTSITNATNIVQYMTMYDYICRNDVDTPDVIGLWDTGMNRSYTTGKETLITSIGATPFMASDLTQYFKIVKSTKVTLGAGATHQHRHRHNVHRTVWPVRFMRTAGAVEGLTSGTVYVIQGQPVEATAGSIGAITTGIVDLNVVSSYVAECGQKTSNRKLVTANTQANTPYQATQSTGVFKAISDSNLTTTTTTGVS